MTNLRDMLTIYQANADDWTHLSNTLKCRQVDSFVNSLRSQLHINRIYNVVVRYCYKDIFSKHYWSAVFFFIWKLLTHPSYQPLKTNSFLKNLWI